MTNLLVIGITIIVSSAITHFWVKGIDHMKKNYPDYKGDDFLDWGNPENKNDI
jgi:hypothetical protein